MKARDYRPTGGGIKADRKTANSKRSVAILDFGDTRQARALARSRGETSTSARFEADCPDPLIVQLNLACLSLFFSTNAQVIADGIDSVQFSQIWRFCLSQTVPRWFTIN